MLTAVVSKHESRARCIPATVAIKPELCEGALQKMPATDTVFQFLGPNDKPSGTKYSRLPQGFKSGELVSTYSNYLLDRLGAEDFSDLHSDLHCSEDSGRSCEIMVQKYPSSGESHSTWFELWTSAVDIYTICARHGLTGFVASLGES